MSFVEIWLLVSSAAFGAVIGSFLNVVILRLPREESVVHPRSRCPVCETQIAWFDNVPILSWILLGGKCRKCRTSISPRYAMIEALTAALTVYLAYRLLLPPLAAGNLDGFWYPTAAVFGVKILFVYALVTATFIDLDHTIIPDEITKPGMVIAVLAGLAIPSLHGTTAPIEGLLFALLGVVVGGGFIWGVRVLGRLVFRKEAMGFGDVKYMGLIGGILGWKGVFLTFFIACIVGSIIGIGVIVIKKSRYLPFAPFLSFGAAVMLIFPEEVWKFLREDYPAFVRGLMGG